jgi:hypothetical protein
MHWDYYAGLIAPGGRIWRGSRFGAENIPWSLGNSDQVPLRQRPAVSLSHRNLDWLDEDILYGDGRAIFNEGFDVRLDGPANVYDVFFNGFALRVASGQSGTENVLAAFGFLLEDHSETMGHRGASLKAPQSSLRRHLRQYECFWMRKIQSPDRLGGMMLAI